MENFNDTTTIPTFEGPEYYVYLIERVLKASGKVTEVDGAWRLSLSLEGLNTQRTFESPRDAAINVIVNQAQAFKATQKAA